MDSDCLLNDTCLFGGIYFFIANGGSTGEELWMLLPALVPALGRVGKIGLAVALLLVALAAPAFRRSSGIFGKKAGR